MGKAFGYGLAENVEDGYEYLMDNFIPDDKLFVFGFSRGAFTARSLVGMVCKVGILQKGSRNLIPYATKVYTTRGNEDVAEKSSGHTAIRVPPISSGSGIPSPRSVTFSRSNFPITDFILVLGTDTMPCRSTNNARNFP